MRVPGIERDPARGARIRERREQHLHLRQPDLAERVGVSLRTYWGWEQGDVMTHPNLRVLAEELGTTSLYLLTGEESADQETGEPEERLDELSLRVSRLEVSLRERLADLEGDIHSLSRTAEEDALDEPLPGEEGAQSGGTDAPPQETEPAKRS